MREASANALDSSVEDDGDSVGSAPSEGTAPGASVAFPQGLDGFSSAARRGESDPLVSALSLCWQAYVMCALSPAAATASAAVETTAARRKSNEAGDPAFAVLSAASSGVNSHSRRPVSFPWWPLVPLPACISPLAYAVMFEVLGVFFRSALKAAGRAAAAAAGACGNDGGAGTVAGAATFQLLWPPHPREVHRALLWRLELLHCLNASVSFCLPLISRPRLPRLCCSSPLSARDLPLPAAANSSDVSAAGGLLGVKSARCIFGPTIADLSRPFDSACTWGVMRRIGLKYSRNNSKSNTAVLGPPVSVMEGLVSRMRDLLLPSRRALAFSASSLWRARLLERLRGGDSFSSEERLGFSPAVSEQLAWGAVTAPRDVLLQRHWAAVAALLAIRGTYPEAPGPQDQEAYCPRVGAGSLSLGRTIPGGTAAAATIASGGGSSASDEGDVSLLPESEFAASLVNQLSQQLLRIPAFALLALERCFSVELRGEGAQDLGGPYAEVLSAVCDDIIASRLFVPSSNARAGVGEGRDFTVPNPLLRDLLVPAAAAAVVSDGAASTTLPSQKQEFVSFWADDAALGVFGSMTLSHEPAPLPSLLSDAPPLLVSCPRLDCVPEADAANPLALLHSQVMEQQRDFVRLAGCWQDESEEDEESLLLRFWGVGGLTGYGQIVARALQAVGVLMGCAVISMSPLNLSLTPAIWTLLLGQQPSAALLLQQDLLAAKHLRRLQAPIAAAASAASAMGMAPTSASVFCGRETVSTAAALGDVAAVETAASIAAAETAAKAAVAAGEDEEEAREEAAAAVQVLLQRGACIDDSVGRPLPLAPLWDRLRLRPQDLPAILNIEQCAKV